MDNSRSKTDTNRRVTLEDVARDAGLSRSTVSLVLRGSSAPSQKAVNAVFGSIQKLGYVYNRTAANLRTQTTHTIGLIIPNIENRFFAEFTVGAELEFDRAERTVILAHTSESIARQQKAIAMMLEHNVDGILMCPAPNTRRADVQALMHSAKPVVCFVRRMAGGPWRYVANDNVAGSRLVVEHLTLLGHRKIAFVGGYPNTSAYHERLSGFRDGMANAGLPVDERLVFPGENSFEGGFRTALRLCALGGRASPERPTAVFCFNDMTALGFMKGLETCDLAPGVDMAVVGFDDIQEAAVWQPPLSTVRSRPAVIGCEAARMLMRAINGEAAPDEEILLPVDLVARRSSGSPVVSAVEQIEQSQ